MFKIVTSVFLIVGCCIQSHFAQEFKEKPVVYESKQRAKHARSSSATGNYDVKYHRLELEVDPAVHYIAGNVTTYFVPSSSFSVMYFDFRDNMIVDSVKYHGVAITASFPTSTELLVDFGGSLASGVLDSVTIYYQGSPELGGFGAFKNATTTCSVTDTVIWTLSEPYGAKNWWPCKEVLSDKIDSTDMFVTTPVKYHTAGNGLLISRDTFALGTLVTDHWKHRYPIPAYLIAFASSEYAIYSDTIDLYNGGELEVLNYVFPCDSALAHGRTEALDTVMNFFIKTFGAYPFELEKYGHAQCRFGGGMEHTTMTFVGGWGYALLIHELAHQWFGDKITCGSWHDIWLNEGFATYLEGLTCEEGIQTTTFPSWLLSNRNHVLSNDYGSVYVDDTTNVSRIFSGRLSYSKGAYVLHMLRWVLGDADFFTGLHNYINDPGLAYGSALTPDLQAHLEAVSNKDLEEFFADWVMGEGWPDYDIAWLVDPTCGNKVQVNLQQSHSADQGTFFEMPVPIRFSDGTQDTTLIFHQNGPADTTFFQKIDFTPNSALFDPDLWLCAKGSLFQEILTVKTIHWTGAHNSIWNESLNWDCAIPTSFDAVVIPNGTPDCVIAAGNLGECRTLVIESGATLLTAETAELNVLVE